MSNKLIINILILFSLFLSGIGFFNSSNIEVKAAPNAETYLLIDMVNAYRAENSLPVVPHSITLSTVAQYHVEDLINNNPVTDTCNLHSWSNANPSVWSSVCYTSDHAKASGMWNKPKEISQSTMDNTFNGNGYENAYVDGAGATASGSLNSWKSSTGHNQVILNQGIWADSNWQSMGAYVSGNYAVLWFSESIDPNGYYENTACFTDVSLTNQFASFICSLKNDSIIGGYPDGTYKPSNNVKRGEMAVYISRAFNIPEDTSCEKFSDMDENTPFYKEAMSLKCAGIIGGSPDGKGGKQYLWNNEVSRGEMAVFIMKAANKDGENIPTDTSCENFNDMNASTPFYTEATSLKCKSIIGGYPNSNGGRDYRFPNSVNRGELSVFVVNAMGV